MRRAPGLLHLAVCCGALVVGACSGSGSTADPLAQGCPSGLPKKTVNGVELCVRSPVAEAQTYNNGNETTTCGDPQTVDLSCYATTRTAPATPATVTLEGYLDTFGLEKSTTNVRIEISKPDGTPLGSATADANHRCARTKTVGTKTQTLAGYTIAGVPTNQLIVVKTSASGFRQTYIFGKYFSSADCQTPAAYTDTDQCHADCFTRNGEMTFRYDSNVISDATWNLIPLTAAYSRGIAPGNAALAGQIHDCKDNRLRHAAVAFSLSAKAKKLAYFNGDCADPIASIPQTHTHKDSLYAILDAQPGKYKLSAEAMSGGSVVDLGIRDVELFAGSVTLFTIGPPPPVVQ